MARSPDGVTSSLRSRSSSGLRRFDGDTTAAAAAADNDNDDDDKDHDAAALKEELNVLQTSIQKLREPSLSALWTRSRRRRRRWTRRPRSRGPLHETHGLGADGICCNSTAASWVSFPNSWQA